MEKLNKLLQNQVHLMQQHIENLLNRNDWCHLPQKGLAFEASTDLSQLSDLGFGLPLDKDEKIKHLFYRSASYFESGLLLQKKIISASKVANVSNEQVTNSPELEDSNDSLDSVLGSTAFWSPLCAFQEGLPFPLYPKDMDQCVSLVPFPLVEVHKVETKKLFETLMLKELIPSKNITSDCLIFRPHPDYFFSVTSFLPDIWLKGHVEKIHFKLLHLLADDVTE